MAADAPTSECQMVSLSVGWQENTCGSSISTCDGVDIGSQKSTTGFPGVCLVNPWDATEVPHQLRTNRMQDIHYAAT